MDFQFLVWQVRSWEVSPHCPTRAAGRKVSKLKNQQMGLDREEAATRQTAVSQVESTTGEEPAPRGEHRLWQELLEAPCGHLGEWNTPGDAVWVSPPRSSAGFSQWRAEKNSPDHQVGGEEKGPEHSALLCKRHPQEKPFEQHLPCGVLSNLWPEKEKRPLLAGPSLPHREGAQTPPALLPPPSVSHPVLVERGGGDREALLKFRQEAQAHQKSETQSKG